MLLPLPTSISLAGLIDCALKNLGSGVVKSVVEGWTISSMTNYHSGDPLDIRVGSSLLNNGGGNWPNVTCSSIGTPHSVTQWFDTGCFADPAQYQFGNYKIGDVRGPTVFNTDFSAAKIAVFAASILSAVVGTALLWRASRQERFEEGPQSVGTQVSPPAGVMPDLEQEVFR